MMPAYAIVGGALYVACVMARGLAEIDWDDITECGAGGGHRDHHAADLFDRHRHRARLHHLRAGKLIAGKFADATPAVLVLAVMFAIKFALG